VSVAKKVGIDESTVSRTVSEKYMSTPRGTMPMRRFFTTGGIMTGSGVVSNAAVKDRIKAIVAAENIANPLSDQKIAEILVAEGVQVARRTVAKYRDELKIPGAKDRKVRS
jgi:RNA polymerase sigma-54 factor